MVTRVTTPTTIPMEGVSVGPSRAISAEGLRVLCGAGGGGQAPWSGGDPTAGLVFFDLETTGLNGGAGTVAFVVGFGCFEGSRFHVWQFVLPSFAGERHVLAAVTAAVSRAHTLVTFNGKSFDVPFMEMRWLYHRLETPLPALRHLDLVHPARRFWGPETGGLGALEARVLGFRRRDDVPGFEIPSRYFDYLRSGDPAPLRDVLSHNRLDLASLAVLTGLACELVDGGSETTRDARQCLGLGAGVRARRATGRRERVLRARGWVDVGRRVVRRAPPTAGRARRGAVSRGVSATPPAASRRRGTGLAKLGRPRADAWDVRARGTQGARRAPRASVEGHGSSAVVCSPGPR